MYYMGSAIHTNHCDAWSNAPMVQWLNRTIGAPHHHCRHWQSVMVPFEWHTRTPVVSFNGDVMIRIANEIWWCQWWPLATIVLMVTMTTVVPMTIIMANGNMVAHGDSCFNGANGAKVAIVTIGTIVTAGTISTISTICTIGTMVWSLTHGRRWFH